MGATREEKELIQFFAARSAVALSMLSETAGVIATTCGFDAFVRLVFARGGGRLFVPSDENNFAHSTLAELAGPKAVALIRKFGGGYLQIPTLNGLLSLHRRLRALELSVAGWSNGLIAHELGISERQVARIKHESIGTQTPSNRG